MFCVVVIAPVDGREHWSIDVVIRDGNVMVCCSVSSCNSMESEDTCPKVGVALQCKSLEKRIT